MSELGRTLLRTLGLLPDWAIRAGARTLFWNSWRRFLAACQDPEGAQRARLMDVIGRARDTEFGRNHGFRDVRTIDDYRRQVPVRTYEDFEPYLSRMVAGEPNILISESPIGFARTSGTTGSPKWIPVTPHYLDEMRKPRRVFYRQLIQTFPGLIRGTILAMHTPRFEGRTDSGVPYGSITTMATGAPSSDGHAFMTGTLDAAPIEVYRLEDFEAKYYAILRFAAQTNVRLIAALNPSTHLLLARKLAEHADSLASDLERGSCRGLETLEEPFRSRARLHLRPCPEIAARMRDAGQRGSVRPRDVWPNILGLLSWKGGAAPYYLAQLSEYFPDVPIMDYGYLATEGAFSIPLTSQDAKGVVATLGHFLEFVPQDAMERGDTCGARLCHQLEIGQRYRVLVTGSHGLYRYDLNDVVECVGRFLNTAEIAFVHKGGNMLSITGEKISEAHIMDAFAKAATKTGVHLAGFSAAIELSDPPRYLFAVELEHNVPRTQLRQVFEAIEDRLGAANMEYRAKRISLRLGAPRLVVLRRGAYDTHRQDRIAKGAADGQVKPPHLFRDAEDLLRLGVVDEIGEDSPNP